MKERDVVADQRTAWAMLVALGVILSLVGLLDLGLLFFPPRWASLDWEFGTISATIEGLPLLTVGLGLMTVGSVARGRTGWMRLLSIAFILLALVIITLLVVFALDVPVAMRAVQAAGRETLLKTIAKAGGMGFLYVIMYAALGVWTWRRTTNSQ